MRKLLLVFLVLLFTSLFGAQFEIVSNLEVKPMHMGLIQLSDNDRLDNNHELGALVIVNCGLEDVFFQNTASKISIIPKSGTYWVVMKKKAQYFVISKEGFANYKYDFPSPLEGGTVYEMTIDEKNKQPEQAMIAITSNQNNALVFINGEQIGTITDRVFTGTIPLGNQEIELRKAGFTPQKVTHNFTPEDNRIEINLEPAMPAAVTITSEPEGAIVYINNILFGTTPKSSFFNAGTYPLRIEKEGFTTLNEQITITEPETEKYYQLTDNKSTLTINTLDSATIRLNGKTYQEVNNLKLPPSVIEIEVSHPKAKTITQVITLNQKENRVLDFYPEIAHGTISIVTIPTSAKIELRSDSGEYYTAEGRKNFNDISVGSYQLNVSSSGYKTHREVIALTANQLVQKQISLEKGNDHKKYEATNTIIANPVLNETKKTSDYYNRLKIGTNGFHFIKEYVFDSDKVSDTNVKVQLSYKSSYFFNPKRNFSFESNIYVEGNIWNQEKDSIINRNYGIYLNPNFKNKLVEINKTHCLFFSIGIPISRVYLSESNDLNSNYSQEYNNLEILANTTLGFENMSYYIQKSSLWNKFKKGYSLSTNLIFNIIRDNSNNDPYWLQEVLSTTKIEYSFLDDNIDQHVNPYFIYETYVETKNNDSESIIIGVNYALDFTKHININVDFNLDYLTPRKNASKWKITTFNPQINFFSNTHFELILGYTYEKCSVKSDHYSTENKYNLDVNWLFDFK